MRDPVLFNDHLLRLRSSGALLEPLRQFVSDKEYVKHYVAGVVGGDYTIKTIRVLTSVDEIRRFSVSKLPCVIKPTHMSGKVLVLREERAMADTELLRRWMRTSYYRRSREANYRFLKPKVIVEEFFSGDGVSVPHDYKVFCFHGCPKLIEVDVGRFGVHTRNFYDVMWNRIPIEVKYAGGREDDPRPELLEEMIDVAMKLSRPFASIRVDLYTHDQAVKVGELTSCHGGGTEEVRPSSAEKWLGSLFGTADESIAGR